MGDREDDRSPPAQPKPKHWRSVRSSPDRGMGIMSFVPEEAGRPLRQNLLKVLPNNSKELSVRRVCEGCGMSKVKNNSGYHGVTEPISLSGPTEKYLMQTAEVEKYLSDARLDERQDEAILREEVLGKLDQTVKAWIKKATRISGYGEQFVHEANAKIFTFGSYRLGVHGPGADIDTLCVVPRHATRNEYFFRWLHDILAEMPEVSELHPVPDAHVPVLGFKINGVSIDLLYANLAHAVIP
ncbi:nuclear poly(A) polymerase 1 [Zea mays]|nr:nuclear poly(A) polymerase 1 [Zea mays]|eukprot:XP_008663499.2 nuclear poly(A) polymerase 1 [Zea mays]